jgi:hypothetical protein
MISRSILTFIVCLTIYMIGMMITTYDGVLSLLLQFIVGSTITIISIGIIGALFLPLIFPVVWNYWKKMWFLPSFLTIVAIMLFYLSWMPQYRITVTDPDTNSLKQSFQPTMAVIGWFIMIFSILWNPKIGFADGKRWF